jgi:DNA-binding MarR family transcriptional regulator
MDQPDSSEGTLVRGCAVWRRLSKLRRMKWPRREIKKVGFPTLDHYEVLYHLSQVGSSSIKNLLEAILKPQYATSRLVIRLESEGLVCKVTSESDGRKHLVAITPHGRALVNRMQNALRSSIEEQLCGEFRDDELDSLQLLLSRFDVQVDIRTELIDE